MDYIQNGQAFGSVASRLLSGGMQPGILRPFIERNGKAYMTVWNERKGKMETVPTNNANTTLRREDWMQIDRAVVQAARPRLKIISDLRSLGLTYNLPNAMGTTILETSTIGDITPAAISMDALRESQHDRPEYGVAHLPIPIIHKDFSFTAREIATSRRTGAPLDTTTAELASRKVSELAEALVLGTAGAYKYGGGYVYGLTNYPGRTTATLTDPASTAWTPEDLVNEVLSMRQTSIDANMFGPYRLYVSPAFSQYLDRDYSATKGENTLRQRLKAIEGISDVVTLDHLTGKQALLVQMTSDVIRLVEGMGITTLQWETHGGMQVNFKVMAIWVPQIRADFNSVNGIIHGSV